MKKILFLVVLSTSLFAQEKINQYNEKGQRHGLWKGTYKKTNKPRYEGAFKNGKEIGLFTFFDNTSKGNIIATKNFDTNTNSCYITFYEETGKKVSEGNTVDKKNEGLWKFYHRKSNQLMMIENYKDGKLNGEKKVFYNDGKIAEIATYKNNLLEGLYTKIGSNEKILEELHYKNGKLHGEVKYYDVKGHLLYKGKYRNGIRVGYWKTYNDGDFVKKEKVTSYTRNVFSKNNPKKVETKNKK